MWAGHVGEPMVVAHVRAHGALRGEAALAARARERLLRAVARARAVVHLRVRRQQRRTGEGL